MSSSRGAEWWEKRARLRYRQWQESKATLERVELALGNHADCWPDDPCSELALEVRAAIDGVEVKP